MPNKHHKKYSSTSHISHADITPTCNAGDHNITQSVLTRRHLSQSIRRAGKMLSITINTNFHRRNTCNRKRKGRRKVFFFPYVFYTWNRKRKGRRKVFFFPYVSIPGVSSMKVGVNCDKKGISSLVFLENQRGNPFLWSKWSFNAHMTLWLYAFIEQFRLEDLVTQHRRKHARS